jgi:predicted GIY-YIG superfamily endonuclease
MTVLTFPQREVVTPALLNHYTAIDDDHLLGTIYLLHFVDPVTGEHVKFKHAGHYLGWTGDLMLRMAKHGTYDGAKLMRHVRAAGIEWQVARLWTGTRCHERRLKNRGMAKKCPLCGVLPRESRMEGLSPLVIPPALAGRTSPFSRVA